VIGRIIINHYFNIIDWFLKDRKKEEAHTWGYMGFKKI